MFSFVFILLLSSSPFFFTWHNPNFVLLVRMHVITLTCFLLCLFCCCLLPPFFFKQAVQSTFRMEEIYHSVAQQLDEERRRRISAMQTLTIAEKSNADLKEKLKTKEQQRKSAEAALKGAETQAESQRKLANDIKGQLVMTKEQMVALRQQLEEANKLKDLAEKARLQAEEDKIKAEKERDEAKQHGYDVGVAETEDALRAEVPAVCRAYYTQTWEEALNQAGVDVSSELRKPENIVFPPALRIPNQKDAAPPASQPIKEAQSQHPSSDQSANPGQRARDLKGFFYG